MKKQAVAIKGAYGEKNFGDDALMFFMYKWLKKNKIDHIFYGIKNNYIDKRFKEIKYDYKENIYKSKSKILILGGGTQFFVFKDFKAVQKGYIIRFFSNPIVFVKKVLKKFEKKLFYKNNSFEKTIGLGLGFGPFETQSSPEMDIIKKTISSFDHVLVRDQFSYDFASKINKQTEHYTDICFLPEIMEYSQFYQDSSSIKKIGVIVRDWRYSESGWEYFEKIIKQAEKLQNLGYDVDFILFKDEKNCELILQEKEFNIVKWNPEDQTISEFLSILSKYHLFISARFHGVIFSALLNIPSIAIEIEPKLKVTKEYFGEAVQLWKHPFNDDLCDLVSKIDYPKSKSLLESSVKQQGQMAESMFKSLALRLTQN